MQILFTRSKISLRRFYESFTFNKQCKSYVRDNKPIIEHLFFSKNEQRYLDSATNSVEKEKKFWNYKIYILLLFFKTIQRIYGVGIYFQL
jgi:hypothetical protein